MLAWFTQEEDLGAFGLDRRTRFATFGLLIASAAFFWFVMLPLTIYSPRRFLFFLTCANLLAILATFVLVGVRRQMVSLREEGRMVPFITFWLSLCGTFYAAAQVRSSAPLSLLVYFFDVPPHQLQSFTLSLVLAVIQVCALLVYVLSYLPFGHTILWYAIQPVVFCCSASTRVCRSATSARTRRRTSAISSRRAVSAALVASRR